MHEKMRDNNTYQRDETVVLEIEYRTTDDVLVDPDTVTISVYEPDGTLLVTAQTATKESTGTYSYDVLVASDTDVGNYDVRWRAKTGTRYQIDKDVYEVEI